jgi:hypothetical protein
MLDVSFHQYNSRRATLTVLNRFGKQRARALDLYLSKPVMKIRIWMRTSERDSNVGAGVPGYGESRRSEPTWSGVLPEWKDIVIT